MSYEIEYDEQSQCINARMQGVVDAKAIRDFAEAVRGVVKQHNGKRLLNDLRNAELKMSTLDIYIAPSLVGDVFAPTTKRAVVVSERSEDSDFFETVCTNQGQFVKIFTDIEAAKKWLAE